MSAEPNAVPIVDLPRPVDITLTGDVLAVVKNMTQTERDALLVNLYRYVQEIAGFVRGMEAAVGGMSQQGGMMGMLARQMSFPNGK